MIWGVLREETKLSISNSGDVSNTWSLIVESQTSGFAKKALRGSITSRHGNVPVPFFIGLRAINHTSRQPFLIKSDEQPRATY